jgi:K+-sensing histidine kinase KdpD
LPPVFFARGIPTGTFGLRPYPAKIAAMSDILSRVLGPLRPPTAASTLRGYLFTLMLLGATALLIAALISVARVERMVGMFVFPVLIAAIRWGIGPGLFAAFTATLLIHVLFTRPGYGFQLQDWDQAVRLVVYIVVAFIAARLAQSVKDHAETAERAINETRRRQETDQLREALIGSVSHELRTPMASILGATTVLCSASAVRADPKLEGLAGVVSSETERLNNVIQNLLDATRISSEGLRPRFEWTEVSDIVNAALTRHRARLDGHMVERDVAGELPLVYVDPVMVEQALGQILDNAAKYSPEAAPVRISARTEQGAVALSVADRGAGLTAEERARLGERFFRGERTAATTVGSGFGVWIARAFLHANGGSLDAASAGPGEGATFIIRLPIPPHKAVQDPENE